MSGPLGKDPRLEAGGRDPCDFRENHGGFAPRITHVVVAACTVALTLVIASTLSKSYPVDIQLVSPQTKRRRTHMPRPPVLSSIRSPWQGIRVEYFKGGPANADEEAPVWHHVLVQLEEATSFDWRSGARTGRTYIPPWNVGVYPALHPITVRNQDTRDFICIAVEPEFLRRIAHDVSSVDQLRLAFRPVNDDPLIRGIALALKAELEAGCPGGRWYGENLAGALAAHLVRRYSAPAAGAAEPVASVEPAIPSDGFRPRALGGLGRNRLHDAIEFIHRNLADEVHLDDLARATNLSPYHFARLFKRSTGFAPHQYLIRRRVERARELLLTSSLSISEVALQSGFCDQSHLTSHFKRVYGVTPMVFLNDYARRRAAG